MTSGNPDHNKLATTLLGLPASIPLSTREMADALQVTFYPPHQHAERLDGFTETLQSAFSEIGVAVLPYEEALLPESENKIRPGVAIIEQGEGIDEALAINRVTSLYENPLVAVYDRPAPVHRADGLQAKLDAIVSVLAWNLTHVPIFVEDDAWTICTMNGSVVRCGAENAMPEHVLNALVPKLTAQVVPPQPSEITTRKGALDVEEEGYLSYVEDFIESAATWEQNGLMLSHTSVEDLSYRSRFYERIVSAYLDNRTGMSYGFLARQLPVTVTPAVRVANAPPALRQIEGPTRKIDDALYARVQAGGSTWVVNVPDVWVLSTRSGCNKTNPDPRRDIVRMGLRQGEIVFDTPAGVDPSLCQPSYDTRAILAHAVGNAIAASILRAVDREAAFPKALGERGLSISHWHGYPDDGEKPAGYSMHGADNPPVSCSTPQSAVYALTGKLAALDDHLRQEVEYMGDVHIEPHHGTNISGTRSLAETAAWVDRKVAADGT